MSQTELLTIARAINAGRIVAPFAHIAPSKATADRIARDVADWLAPYAHFDRAAFLEACGVRP